MRAGIFLRRDDPEAARHVRIDVGAYVALTLAGGSHRAPARLRGGRYTRPGSAAGGGCCRTTARYYTSALIRTYRYGAALLLAAAVIALTGCAAATTMAEPTPPPDPPSLLGTWQVIEPHPEHVDGTIVFTLTFMPERWVLVIDQQDAAGEMIDADARSGTWRQTETTIEKLYQDEDGAGATVAKRYTLTDDALVVQRWIENGADAPDTTMSRVTDPAILTTLAGGSWVRESEEEHEGNLEPWRWTITAVPDGKFTYTFEDPRGLFEMTGSWTDDPANKTISVTVETVPAALSNWIGYPLLFAYAPNGAPDRINVSLFIVEQMWNSDQQQWQAPNDGTPYGGYGMVMDRVMP